MLEVLYTFAFAMRTIVATILLLLMTFQVMYRGIVVSSYFANKAYIAAVLCENKDKPELQCEGKCHLQKQLRKADAPDSNTSSLTPKLETSPYTAPALQWAIVLTDLPASITVRVSSENKYTFAYCAACFNPPRV